MATTHYFLLYPLLGILAGFLAGLLGIGGGMVIVPCLLWIFPLMGVDSNVSVHMAIATSMATVIVTQITAVRSHCKYCDVDILWKLARKLWPGIIIGAIIGGVIADGLNSRYLALLFGVVTLLLAIKVAVVKESVLSSSSSGYPWKLPKQIVIVTTTFVIGALSSLLGIGGGSFTVPFLKHSKLPMRIAIAMSAFCGLPLSIVATLAYMLVGLNDTTHIKWTTGYLYWPAFIGIGVTSMLFTALGVKLAHRMPTNILKWIFVAFLLFVGVRMIFL